MFLTARPLSGDNHINQENRTRLALYRFLLCYWVSTLAYPRSYSRGIFEEHVSVHSSTAETFDRWPLREQIAAYSLLARYKNAAPLGNGDRVRSHDVDMKMKL
jgi:hypothetical protein